MDCCESDTTRRPDRPHTFLMHEMSSCVSCERPIEGRVVLRDDKVFTLVYCPDCGQTEHATSDDANLYVETLVARGVVPDGHEGDWELKRTTSTCPTCLELTEAIVVVRDGKAFFKKDCRRCGPSEAMVSENAEYYAKAYAYARAGTQPLQYGNTVSHGCPTDCGTCEDHEQHTCLPIVEVTDHCNLECPICIVNNQYSTHMEPAAFARIVDRLIAAEGEVESLAISGGEPTSHPQILELLKIADRPEIGRVLLITNGLRLGKDRDFARAIKDSGAYVALQLDGFDAATHTIVRGRDLTKEKDAALAALRDLDIPTQLIFVAVKGVNDHQIGQCVELLMSEDHILSVNFQPVAHTGLGGGSFEHDPMDRITIPGVIERIAEQTDVFQVPDFYPLPCSHPQCVSLTYLLKLNDGSFVPFPRFVDYTKHGELLRSSATLPASSEVHDAMLDVIHDVFANADEIDRGEEILDALRDTLKTMFPTHQLTPREQVRVGEARSKSIFLHAYMDRHDFDLERLRKCCHHYPQEDGRVMPACGFNMFHRGAAQGENTPRPEWSKQPATLRVVD